MALITGGDSGIGRAVAVLFAREGADVAIAYPHEDADAEETKAAVEAEGRRASCSPATSPIAGFCREAVARTVKEFGRIDVLVNNAAFQVHAEDFVDLTPEHFDETLKTNLYGYFHMAQAAVPQMRPGSAIINTGSVTGIDGSKELIDYSTDQGRHPRLHPRAGRQSAAARHPRQRGGARPGLDAAQPVRQAAGGRRRSSAAKTPMKRPAQPEEIAPAYVFLASPQCSSYITGEILPIVGGY